MQFISNQFNILSGRWENAYPIDEDNYNVNKRFHTYAKICLIVVPIFLELAELIIVPTAGKLLLVLVITVPLNALNWLLSNNFNYYWLQVFLRSANLASLSMPFAAAATLLIPLGNTYFWAHRFFSTKSQPEVKFPPAPHVDQKVERRFEKDSFSDMKLFLEREKPFDDNTCVRLDLSFTPVDGDRLLLILSHLFKRQSTPKYPHEINLVGCSEINVELVQAVLTLFPKLILHLTDTPLTSEDIHQLQSEFLEATFHFNTVGRDLFTLYQHKQFCDIAFFIEGNKMEAHSFILPAFGPVKATHEYRVEGVSANEFNSMLEKLYRGHPVEGLSKVKLQVRVPGPFTHAVKLRVGNREFPAHRGLLAARSEYFRGLFSPSFKERKNEAIDLTHTFGNPEITHPQDTWVFCREAKNYKFSPTSLSLYQN